MSAVRGHAIRIGYLTNAHHRFGVSSCERINMPGAMLVNSLYAVGNRSAIRAT